MTGITAALVGIGGGTNSAVYNLQAGAYEDQGDVGTHFSAGVTLQVGFDGVVTIAGDVNGVLTSYNWITPDTTAPAHYIRATLSSGTFTTGTTGSWLSLASTQVWFVGIVSPGGKSTTATFQIATDAAGTNVVATAIITLTAILS